MSTDQLSPTADYNAISKKKERKYQVTVIVIKGLFSLYCYSESIYEYMWILWINPPT